MIRWREEKECYRVTIAHHGSIGCLGVLGTVLAAVGVFAVLTLVSVSQLATLDNLLCPACFTALGAGLIWASAAEARQFSWVEIAVRGGRARWMGDPGRPANEYVEVVRFRRIHLAGARVGVEALLRDSQVVPVFGPWKLFDVRRADKLVREMNDLLCSDGR